MNRLLCCRIANVLRWQVALAGMLLASCCQAGGLTIARRGESPEMEIVLSSGGKATEGERFAATEFRDFLKRQTGVELGIRDGLEGCPPRAVVIGVKADDPTLGEEGFRLKVKGGRLLICGGGVRGTLFGVYETLERFGGCGWYSSQYEVVPELEEFVVPDDLDETQRPAIKLRSVSAYDVWREPRHFALRNKLYVPEKFGPAVLKIDRTLSFCHTFDLLLPPKKFFDCHPEYFSEVGGKRIKNQTQLCLTNPDVARICTAEVLKRIAATYPKGARVYGVSQNDGDNHCTCSKCMAVEKAEGSASAALIMFVNKIAEAVEEKYPDVFIGTLTYTWTRCPPKSKSLKFRRNVLPCFCTIEGDFSKPIATGRWNREILRDLRGWKERSSQLCIWNYTTDFMNYLYPWPNVRALAPDIRLFRDCGAVFVYEQGSGGPDADWSMLKSWLMAKLLWNPDLDEGALLDRFFRDVYGPGASDLRLYFDELHGLPRNDVLSCYENVTSTNLSIGFLDRANAHFESAIRKTKGTAFETNVLRTCLSLDCTRVVKESVRGNLIDGTFDQNRFLGIREGARRLIGMLGPNLGRSLSECRPQRINAIIRNYARRDTQQPDRRKVVLGYWALDVGGGLYWYEKSPDAVEGWALNLPKHGRLNYAGQEVYGRYSIDNIAVSRGKRLRLRARLKLENGASLAEDESLFRMMVVGKGGNSAKLKREFRAGELRGRGYVWLEVAAWQPKTGDLLLVTPLRDIRGSDGKVLIDSFEFTVADGND